MTIRNYLNKTPRIADSAYIDEAAVIIGDVTIGEDVSVWPMVVARGDHQPITIGDRSNIQDGTVIHITSASEFVPDGYPCTIGSDVTVGHKAMLHACKIGSHCLIGMSATVLDGAVIDDHVMVGAGSLVPMGKHLESGYLYLGSPVKQVRRLKDEELRFIEYSARHYVETKNNFKKGS